MSTTDPANFSLAAILESPAAGPLAAELQNLRGRPLVIAGDAVSRISSLCMQVLLSADLTWKADGISFCIAAPSEALQEAARILGLNDGQLAMGSAA